ncbi:hypothetical protein [Paraglaciecola arctica]|uniref:hypothetical protein n=1 Tax=Paraglaciecola arctica TaxID=1128911 RepID=UPI001C0689EB|nr:hypothetical protein [Paraglaciecola arctica]MBU3003023.1 hypothetical protein [Paraglaciecola arctica]
MNIAKSNQSPFTKVTVFGESKMLTNSVKAIFLIAIYCLFSFSSQSFANENTGRWDLSFDLKTNHLWHGFIVTDGVMTSGELTYKTADNKTTFGLWGGGSFNGEFKEFTYFASHQFSDQLFVEIVNHGNHSSIPDSDVDIFDYSSDPLKTGNFIDVGLGYTFEGEMPISVYYSVIVQGVDSFVDADSGKKERAYTNYIEISAPVWKGKDGETVDVFIGGAFSPIQEKNFYSDNANINNLGFTYKKQLQVAGYSLPVSATAMWNPALNHGALQVAVNLF